MEQTMILGMPAGLYTALHVFISLVGIASGFVVIWGLIAGRRLGGWTAIFLSTTIATSVTGYGFPAHELLPSHIVGALSLIALALAVAARYRFHMEGSWRGVYVISAAVAEYFNVFVLVVQSFQKSPALKALAPTQTEPPFLVAQIAVLILFVVLTVLAMKKFHLQAAHAM